jgi:DNA-binding NarL/FixJ family response regulator
MVFSNPMIVPAGVMAVAGDAAARRPMPFRVCVVKRDRFCAAAIAQLVATIFPDAEIVTVHTAAAALDALRASPARLALVGLALADMDGLDLLRCISQERLAWRLLVIADRWDERAEQVLASARVDGCFNPEQEDSAKLAAAIQRVAEGGSYLGALADDDRPVRNPRKPTLAQLFSPAELRVFAVIGDGCDDREAAEQLGISPTTVHTHRQRIMSKLSVHTRTELMREAVRRGVVRITPTEMLRPGFAAEINERVLPDRSPRVIMRPSGVRS